MDLSSVHGQKLQMLFSHHYKSVDIRVQIKEMFLFFPILRRKFLFFPIFQHFHSYFLQVIWHLTPRNTDTGTCKFIIAPEMSPWDVVSKDIVFTMLYYFKLPKENVVDEKRSTESICTPP